MPGSTYIDALVKEANDQEEEVTRLAQEIAHKHPGADVRVTTNRNGTVNLSIKAVGGSSIIEDIVTGPNGRMCTNVDGVSLTTTGADAMAHLRKRGVYRVAPNGSAPLAHAAMRRSTPLRRWKHYLKRYLRTNRWTFLSALLITPILKFMNHEAFTAKWLLMYATIQVFVLLPLVTGVGALELRQAMRKRVRRQARFVESVQPITRPSVLRPLPTTTDRDDAGKSEEHVEIRDLIRMLKGQRYDSGRTAMIASGLIPSLTVAMAVRLLKTFSFDSSRLEAMRSIAPKILDPQNAYMITEAFQFDSSTAPAMKLISKHARRDPIDIPRARPNVRSAS